MRLEDESIATIVFLLQLFLHLSLVLVEFLFFDDLLEDQLGHKDPFALDVQARKEEEENLVHQGVSMMVAIPATFGDVDVAHANDVGSDDGTHAIHDETEVDAFDVIIFFSLNKIYTFLRLIQNLET